MEDKDVSLELRFDVDQVTKALDYRFRSGSGSIFQDGGRCAGTFHFPAGGRLLSKVVCYSRTADAAKFVITNFTLTSIPTMMPGQSPLSMFDDVCACVTVADWGLPNVEEAGEETKTIVSSYQKLPIIADDGQWQISGYLSVLIEKQERSGKTKRYPRLFYFDPEGTTGTGGDISL